MSAVHLERILESSLVASLVANGSPVREGTGGYMGAVGEHQGYLERKPDHYSARLCLDPQQVIAFVGITQEKEWDKLKAVHGEQRNEKFLARLAKELETRGALGVLRNGIKDHGCHFKLAYFAPASGLNPEHAKLYTQNLLSVMRQVPFSEKSTETIDVVLFLNGIPVATVELKHHMTSQNVQHAMTQYRARDTREPIFAFKRVPAHFAVDNDLVYVTTHVNGKGTYFLPFNMGSDDGAGNPVNPDGFRSAYLWEDIWARDTWLDVLGHFIHVEEGRDEQGKKTERLIFPRFHQLDAVRRVVASCRKHGAGKRYLIQHSAGSGKSNTIAWLVHRLAELHDISNERIFDSVIVITDRRVLDRQLRNTVKGFERVVGLVTGVTQGSKELKAALEEAKPIIVTTVQKFPFIATEIGHLTQRRFAIVIDEAHSGQSGETQRALSAVLNVKSLEDAEKEEEQLEKDLDGEVLKTLESTGMAKNASYFAFTATPKARTLEMFGQADEDGKFHPFSLYTMRQAIEEKFIMDVLQNYTTFKTYFDLTKKIEEDPEYNKAAAIKVMLRYADLNEAGIERKARIMVDHFTDRVSGKIGGRAKAMVVTRSRLHAVRYKQAFDKILREQRSPFRALVAFSGTVKDDGLEHTEYGMNGLPETQTAEEFKLPECKFLIVAEKFQTGFDQPLLHTMYVDKTLTGLNAVQTLSRLNRIHPEKQDTFVLDFANEAEMIQQAFEPYYRATILSEGTDPNKLYDLERMIKEFELFDDVQVGAYCAVFYDKSLSLEKKLPMLHAILDPIRDRYMAQSEDLRSEFKKLVEQFVRLYAFLSQIVSFQDVDLEKLYQFCRLLRGKLPLTRGSLPKEVLDQIQLDHYRVVQTGTDHLRLSGEGELLPSDDLGTGSFTEDEKEPLSELIKAINEAFGTEFDEGDRVMIAEVERRVLADKGLQDAVLHNKKESVKLIFASVFDKALTDLIDDNLDFYKKVVDNEAMQADLKQGLFEAVYRKLTRYDGSK